MTFVSTSGVMSYDLERRGLDESLEAYAARIKRTPDEARFLWRAEALRLLHVAGWTHDHVPKLIYDHVTRGHAAIAPGVSVPTRAVEWSDP